MKLIVVFILVTLTPNFVAGLYFPDHLALACLSCHQKFSYQQPYAPNLSAPVRNPWVISEFPCYDHDCHYSAPGHRIGNRYSIHMRKEICKNCHAAIEGEYDIHTVHQEIKEISVNCKICHQSLRGWNSSLVIIPAPKEEQMFVYEGIEIAIPNKECEYCHRNIIGKTKLHDVHEPVLKIACQDCHGTVMESRPDLIAKVTGEPLPKEKEKVESLFLREFSAFFNEIAQQLSSFYTTFTKPE